MPRKPSNLVYSVDEYGHPDPYIPASKPSGGHFISKLPDNSIAGGKTDRYLANDIHALTGCHLH
jgi:hypothetical protein